jgi:hypothetical protein
VLPREMADRRRDRENGRGRARVRSGAVVSRGPGRVMRAIEALLPPHDAARGLPSSTLARLIYGEGPTDSQVNSIERAARRLVARGVAASTVVHGGLTIYYRAEGAPKAAAINDCQKGSYQDAVPTFPDWG